MSKRVRIISRICHSKPEQVRWGFASTSQELLGTTDRQSASPDLTDVHPAPAVILPCPFMLIAAYHPNDIGPETFDDHISDLVADETEEVLSSVVALREAWCFMPTRRESTTGPPDVLHRRFSSRNKTQVKFEGTSYGDFVRPMIFWNFRRMSQLPDMESSHRLILNQQQTILTSCSEASDLFLKNSREELRALGLRCYNKPLVAWSLHKVKQRVVPVST